MRIGFNLMSMLINTIKRVRRRLRLRRIVASLFRYDMRRFINFAGSLNMQSENALEARIIMAYHVIEKGLTMPNMRIGFGRRAVSDLIDVVADYERRFGSQSSQVAHAAKCILAYYHLHDREGVIPDGDMVTWQKIKSFAMRHADMHPMEIPLLTRMDFFKWSNSDFKAFAKSRHTVRHFAGCVDNETIMNAVELAMTAPSACNRQYVKVHCISNHEMRDSILALQNGNRGFGGEADKLLVVTADMSGIRWCEERNDGYVNGGIFIMNLSYSLHYYKLGSCILNWSVDPQKDIALRSLIGIRDSETVIALIACGQVAEILKLAPSPRKKLNEVLTFHE